MLEIKINEFEGPLDLLLHLIENKKMNILDINISSIIDEYLKIIAEHKEDQFKLKVEFLQMASTLLEIKAFSILRTDKKNKTEEDLEKRLIEYKLFKELAKTLSERENEYYVAFKKRKKHNYISEIVEHDNSLLNIDAIKECIENLVRKSEMADRNALKVEFSEDFSVEDAISEIEALKEDDEISFSMLLRGKFSRDRIVSFFLAILELYKASKIDIILKEDDFSIKREKYV